MKNEPTEGAKNSNLDTEEKSSQIFRLPITTKVNAIKRLARAVREECPKGNVMLFSLSL